MSANCFTIAAEMMILHYEGYKLHGYDTDDKLTIAAKQNKDVFYSVCKLIDTGKISPLAQVNRLSGQGNQNTGDHFISRTKSSFEFMYKWREGEFTLNTIDQASEWVKDRCYVNTVTKQENSKLRSIQNHPTTKDLPWQEQYAIAGIPELEDKWDLRKRFIYKIDEKVYFSAKEVAEAFGISESTVNSRCEVDKAGKYSGWHRFHVQYDQLKDFK